MRGTFCTAASRTLTSSRFSLPSAQYVCEKPTDKAPYRCRNCLDPLAAGKITAAEDTFHWRFECPHMDAKA
eukprot:scaffold53198_cov27-Prasinocladus_malaysianus.AAC.6